MKRRGRPPYPDILTPREWEVLDLLCAGLTNPEIAERLGVTRDAVKYHVSQILSKLGVATRDEAAAWRPYERPWWAAAIALIAGAATPLSRLGRIVAIGASLAALGGLVLLTWGVLAMGGSGGDGNSQVGGQSSASPVQSRTPGSTVAPSPTPALPDILGGVTITPLDVGSPVELPRDLALVIETGCTGCAGGLTGLVRVYARPDGTIDREHLTDRAALSLPPRVASRPDGTTYEVQPGLTGYAIQPDGSKIVIGLCTRGSCSAGGISEWSADAQVAIFSSSDGGVSWSEQGRVEVAAEVVAILPDDRVLLATWSEPLKTVFRTFPDMSVVEPPVPLEYPSVIVLANGEWIWLASGKSRIRSDGRPLLDIPPGGPSPDDILVDPSTTDSVALFSGGETRAPYSHYLVPFDGAGAIGRGKFAHAGESVAWNTHVSVRLGAVLPNGSILGNAWVPTEEIANNGQPLVTIPVPVIIDLSSGTMSPLRPFTDPGSSRSRDTVAFQRGPFARVVNTEGTCVYIRESPNSAAPALDCAAEGVLLRDLGETADAEGATWLRVATPAGVEGWASAQYLEL